MMIQGKSCTLTVAKDGYYYPLPYSEETVREASKGYALPGVIGKRKREKKVITGRCILGSVTTMLEYLNVYALFLLLCKCDDKFDLFADRICDKKVYKNLSVKEFEIRGENKNPFFLKLEINDNEDSYTTDWEPTTPDLKWNADRIFLFDGHSITADGFIIPLVYRFCLTGNFTDTSKYKITLYYPLNNEFFPLQNTIKKLTIQIDWKTGINLELYDLRPVNDLYGVNCSDTVLCSQTFEIKSYVILNIRNEKEKKEVVLV